jgi:hypothetical protein
MYPRHAEDEKLQRRLARSRAWIRAALFFMLVGVCAALFVSVALATLLFLASGFLAVIGLLIGPGQNPFNPD